MTKLGDLSASFAGHVGVTIHGSEAGVATGSVPLAPWLMNNHHVVHGGVVFTLVDTVMGAALYPQLRAGELCATIDIHISYLNPITDGVLECRAEVVKHGKRVAHLEAVVSVAGREVARASGNFAIFTPSHPTGKAGPSA